jgi:hypothetical protein
VEEEEALSLSPTVEISSQRNRQTSLSGAVAAGTMTRRRLQSFLPQQRWLYCHTPEENRVRPYILHRRDENLSMVGSGKKQHEKNGRITAVYG